MSYPNSSRNLALRPRAGCFVAMLTLVGLLAGPVTAQTFTTLHGFTGTSINSSGVDTNSDGANPEAGLILSGNTLYGTTSSGGSNGNGTVFKVNTDGTGFRALYTFTATSGPLYTNSDGDSPYASLILSNNNLYGTATGGGSSGMGTVFAVNIDGTGFRNLHSFIGTDGAEPWAALVLSGNTLYGTTYAGGVPNEGTAFAVNIDGTGFRNLHSFSDNEAPGPMAPLVLSGNTLYGTTFAGGVSNAGTVFAVHTDGTGFTNLHNFIGNDGDGPSGGLILSDQNLYGTASGRNTQVADPGFGTVFAMHIDGTGFTNLHTFTRDESSPQGKLTLSGNMLYGALAGGEYQRGTVFAVKTDGTGFTNLHGFTGNDGANPPDGVIVSGNTLYGTTISGGCFEGTVFSLTLPPPQLDIALTGASVVAAWPTNTLGLNLQSTTNLASPVWTTNSPAPVVVNGQNIVTNPVSDTQQFFRLSH